MFKAIRSSLRPPQYDDDGKNRIVNFLHIILYTIMSIAVLVGIIDAFAGVYLTGMAITVGLIPLAFSLWLARHDRVQAASYLTLFSLLATVTALLSIGQGIHDIGLIFYSLIIIIASYLLSRRAVIALTALIIASVAIVVWGEIFKILPLKISPEYFIARPADFFIVSLSLIIGAVAISTMSDTLQKSTTIARASEARWRSLVDNAPDVILMITPEGLITFLNNTAAQNPAGIKLGQNAYDLLPASLQSRAKKVVKRALEGEPETREITINFTSEIIHWYSVRIGPVYGPDQQVTGAMIIASDIQHMKDIETELRKSRDASRNRAEQLATLYDISKTVTSLRDLDNALQLILAQVDAILPMDAFCVTFYDREKNEITHPLVYDSGQLWDEKPQKLDADHWVARAINTRKAFILHRSEAEVENFKDLIPVGNRSELSASIMVAPLIVGEDIIGVISIHSYTFDAYNEEYLELLSGAANLVAIAVENSRLYDKLQKELVERKRAEAEIRMLNVELEHRVHRRTAELEEANNELASFTYTISHDLRAPLRGIHGLSHIFIDEYGAQLTETGQDYIRRIEANARQMGQLIDDLLTFTHLGRQQLYRKEIDMAEIVRAVFNQLVEPGISHIQLDLKPMPTVIGDRTLLFQVITNLLSNAIKFTRNRQDARVEFGSELHQSEVQFYVRDNGAGFDMDYSSKLFGVFQRLHRQDEFEGTGVGLAIVKRIIQRHGGRVWAEGTPGLGATFYFTLPT